MLTLDTHVTDGDIVVTLCGELDLREADVVGEVIGQAVDATTGTVVIDLAHLRFCDSSGITTFIRARRRADTRHIPFRMINPTDTVANLFHLTGMDDYLGVEQPPN